jgi:hypothetical protein
MAGLPDDVVSLGTKLARRSRTTKPAVELGRHVETQRRRATVTVSVEDYDLLVNAAAEETTRTRKRVSLDAYLSSIVAEHCRRRRAEHR